jgi:hypothetical protein
MMLARKGNCGGYKVSCEGEAAVCIEFAAAAAISGGARLECPIKVSLDTGDAPPKTCKFSLP